MNDIERLIVHFVKHGDQKCPTCNRGMQAYSASKNRK